MTRLAIFASGTGTNFETLQEKIQEHPELGIEVGCLICDQPKALVIEKAEGFDIPTWVHSVKEFSNKQEYEEAILEYLRDQKIDFIVLAGYMKIVTNVLLDAYPHKIINLHPALLPAFPGRTSIEDALAYGVKVTGVTVHYVDAGIDSGPIIAQEPVRILQGDTFETLAPRIHEVEHELYFKSMEVALREQGLVG